MELIFVAGSWGSGTTAVIGALDALGVPTFGPYFQSNDPKTANTFELQSFRQIVLNHVDEASISYKENYQKEFIPALEKLKQELEGANWPEGRDNDRRIFALKMPLATICLPEIIKVFKTRIILVHRPFTEIEASRARRNWLPLYGSAGSSAIYNQMFARVFHDKLSFMGLSYGDFVNETKDSMETIIDYCQLGHLRGNMENAISFVRKP